MLPLVEPWWACFWKIPFHVSSIVQLGGKDHGKYGDGFWWFWPNVLQTSILSVDNDPINFNAASFLLDIYMFTFVCLNSLSLSSFSKIQQTTMQPPRLRCQSKCVQIKHAVTLWLFNVAMDIFPVHYMGKSTAAGPLSSSQTVNFQWWIWSTDNGSVKHVTAFYQHLSTNHNAYTIIYWLVVWNIFSIYWEESAQLTFIFFRGVGQPPTIYI